jgi:hypothetical protein
MCGRDGRGIELSHARVLGVYETPPAETTDSLSEAKRRLYNTYRIS